jgi:hypothetical protein
MLIVPPFFSLAVLAAVARLSWSLPKRAGDERGRLFFPLSPALREALAGAPRR